MVGHFIPINFREVIRKESWQMQKEYPKLYLIVWKRHSTKRGKLVPILEASKDGRHVSH